MLKPQNMSAADFQALAQQAQALADREMTATVIAEDMTVQLASAMQSEHAVISSHQTYYPQGLDLAGKMAIKEAEGFALQRAVLDFQQKPNGPRWAALIGRMFAYQQLMTDVENEKDRLHQAQRRATAEAIASGASGI